MSRGDSLKTFYLRYRVVAAFLLVPLLWGVNWTVMKIGILSIPPFLILGSRQLLAGLAHAGLARATGRPFPQGKELLQAVALGLLLAGISNGLMFWGVQYITSGLASILFGTMPFFVAFLSAPLLGERLTLAKLFGVAVGFGGVALLLGGGAGAVSDLALWGEAALMLSAVTWALPLVLTRKWLSKTDTVALTSIEMLSGAVILLPLGLATEGLGRVHLTVEGVLSLGYMVVFAGFIGFALYYWMVRQMSATRLALTSFITPGVAVITGIIVLSEPMESTLFIGLILVAAGIIIVNRAGEPTTALTAGMVAGAYVYTCNSEPRYLLVKRTPREGAIWAGVGGAAEGNETPVETVLREATEETGFARFDRVVDLQYSCELQFDRGPFVLHYFGLQVLEQMVPVLDDEHEAYQWADYETAMPLLDFENQREALRRLHRMIACGDAPKSDVEG